MGNPLVQGLCLYILAGIGSASQAFHFQDGPACWHHSLGTGGLWHPGCTCQACAACTWEAEENKIPVLYQLLQQEGQICNVAYPGPRQHGEWTHLHTLVCISATSWLACFPCNEGPAGLVWGRTSEGQRSDQLHFPDGFQEMYSPNPIRPAHWGNAQ